MTPEQIALVQASFQRVVLIKDQLGRAFYQELFRIAPQVRPIFPADMAAQEAKLTDALIYVVDNLTRPDVIEETLVPLALRHLDYGAQPAHFAAVGMALMTALRQTAPGGITPQESNAWMAAYSAMADMMVAEFPAKRA
ncbi:MAG: globin domain-containing protein [Pseudomonadota bacterium]